jgi:hypothetical protein
VVKSIPCIIIIIIAISSFQSVVLMGKIVEYIVYTLYTFWYFYVPWLDASSNAIMKEYNYPLWSYRFTYIFGSNTSHTVTEQCNLVVNGSTWGYSSGVMAITMQHFKGIRWNTVIFCFIFKCIISLQPHWTKILQIILNFIIPHSSQSLSITIINSDKPT